MQGYSQICNQTYTAETGGQNRLFESNLLRYQNTPLTSYSPIKAFKQTLTYFKVFYYYHLASIQFFCLFNIEIFIKNYLYRVILKYVAKLIVQKLEVKIKYLNLDTKIHI